LWWCEYFISCKTTIHWFQIFWEIVHLRDVIEKPSFYWWISLLNLSPSPISFMSAGGISFFAINMILRKCFSCNFFGYRLFYIGFSEWILRIPFCFCIANFHLVIFRKPLFFLFHVNRWLVFGFRDVCGFLLPKHHILSRSFIAKLRQFSAMNSIVLALVFAHFFLNSF
jgi:hypothetical protein